MSSDFFNPVGQAKWTNLGGPGAGTHHYGQNWQSSQALDFGVPVGTPLYAAVAGTLVRIDSEGYQGRSEGIQLGIDGMGSGRSAYYGHLSRIARGVVNGRVVKPGDYLGQSGAPCGVMGQPPNADWESQVDPYPPPCGPPHLHFALTLPGQRYSDSHETQNVDVVGIVQGAPLAALPKNTPVGAPFVFPGYTPPATAQVPVSIGDAWGSARDAIAKTLPNAAQILYDLKPRIIRATK